MPLKNSYKEAVFAFLRRAMVGGGLGDGDILRNKAMQAGSPSLYDDTVACI